MGRQPRPCHRATPVAAGRFSRCPPRFRLLLTSHCHHHVAVQLWPVSALHFRVSIEKQNNLSAGSSSLPLDPLGLVVPTLWAVLPLRVSVLLRVGRFSPPTLLAAVFLLLLHSPLGPRALCGVLVWPSRPSMVQSVVWGTANSGAPAHHSSNTRAQAGNLDAGVIPEGGGERRSNQGDFHPWSPHTPTHRPFHTHMVPNIAPP